MNFILLRGVFSAGSLARNGRHANVNFALCSNNKDQLIDSNNHLNQKLITAIITLDGSTFRDNPITSHRNDEVVIPISCSNTKKGSIKSLV